MIPPACLWPIPIFSALGKQHVLTKAVAHLININFFIILIQVYKKESPNNAAGGNGVSETKLSETVVYPVVYTRGKPVMAIIGNLRGSVVVRIQS